MLTVYCERPTIHLCPIEATHCKVWRCRPPTAASGSICCCCAEGLSTKRRERKSLIRGTKWIIQGSVITQQRFLFSTSLILSEYSGFFCFFFKHLDIYLVEHHVKNISPFTVNVSLYTMTKKQNVNTKQCTVYLFIRNLFFLSSSCFAI